MTLFKNANCLDRFGAMLTGVAGAAAVAVSIGGGTLAAGPAIAAGVLGAACAGTALRRQRLEDQESDAVAAIERCTQSCRTSWRKWAQTSASAGRNLQDLAAAASVFEDYFGGGGAERLPSSDAILRTGLDAKAIAALMLEQAARVAPHDYASEDAATRTNREFFHRVVEGAFGKLVEHPAFADTLSPAIARMVADTRAALEALGVRVEGLIGTRESTLRHVTVHGMATRSWRAPPISRRGRLGVCAAEAARPR